MNNSVSLKKEKFDKDYEYSPFVRIGSSLTSGLIARGVLIFFLVLGLSAFFADCFTPGVGFIKLLLFSAIWTAVFCSLFCGGKATIAGAVGAVAVLAVWAVITPSVVSYTVNGIRCTLDTAGDIFIKYGYENLSFLKIGYSAIDKADALNSNTYFLFTAVLALVFSALCMRRVLLIPTLVISLAVCAPGITYNFVNANWGFAFVVLALFSIAAVRMFEFCYKAKKEDRIKRASMGGYLGGFVAVIALLCIMIPSLVTKSEWSDIPVISKPVSVARDLVTSVISGDMPNLQEMGIIKNMDEQNSRVITTDIPKYTGRSMLAVKRKMSSSSPLYMRGWVASPKFDGKAWYSPSNDETDAYAQLLGQISASAGYGESYTPDLMTEAFLDIIFAPDMLYDPIAGYKSYKEWGFNVYRTDVSMELGTGSGNLLYIPSTSLVSGGLSAFEDTKAYRGEANRFHEGMMLTNWFNLNKSYSVTTVATNFSTKGSSEIFMKLVGFANAVSSFIRAEHDGTITGDPYAAYENFIYSYGGIDDISSYIEIREFYDRYMEMSDEEQETYYTRYCTLADAYTEYVNNTYINTGYGNVYVQNIVNSMNIDGSLSTHEKVMRVVQHIVLNYEYSLTPKAGTLAGRTPFEQFISETKSGYCTHLATLLTLSLRELGIPARYVEGYLAKSFSSDGEGSYVSDVLDENAHAWVEVYYPGYGWVTYEAARTFAKALYGSEIRLPSAGPTIQPGQDIPSGPSGPSIPNDDPVIDPNDPSLDLDETEKRKFDWGKFFRVLAVLAVVFGGGYLLVKYMKRRADDALYYRKKLLEGATYGADADEYPSVSHEINTTLLAMMTLAGYAPYQGELPTEYALRLDESCPYATDRSFAEVMTLMQKQEFGQSLSNDDLRIISEYTTSFWNDLYASMPKPKRFWHRYITLEV